MTNPLLSDSRTYRYEPLESSRHIRLLRLRGSRAGKSLRSHELISFHLDNAPPFCALSYRWDAEKNSCFVSIAGKVLRVTTNCKQAMIFFGKTMSGGLIWIDAVAINQSDVEEKNMQVALMRDIYRKAHTTLVWLGAALPDEDFQLNLHAALKSGIFDTNNMEMEKREDPNHPFHPRRDQDPEPKLPYHMDCRKVPVTLEHVLQRDWFGRVWMIQEVALSNNILVCCANALFEWEQLVEATRRLAAAQGPNRKSLFDLPLKIMEARDHFQQQQITLSQILQLSRSFGASDPRDKIYGMLGLNDEFAELIGLPDYKKSAKTVWLEMASIYLKKFSIQGLSMLTSAIDLLNMQEALAEYMDEEHREEPIPTWLEGLERKHVQTSSERSKRLENTPSWVPELDFPSLDWPMNDSIKDNDREFSSIESTVQIYGNKLSIQGALIKNITEVPYGNTSGNNRQMWWAWDKWMDLAGWLDMNKEPTAQFRYFTGERMRLVFWKTIFCDVNDEIEDDDTLDWWHNWFCLELWMNLLMMDSRFLIERDSGEQKLGKRTASVALVRNATRHKKFFQAEDLVGIGPLSIQEGDNVVMLQGYKYPFIIRSKPSPRLWFTGWRKATPEYQLVGPCYVHAIWNWASYTDEKLEWKKLIFV